MKFEIFWKNQGYQTRPELRQDIECDYLIVGGGITGVSAAYFLSTLGAKNIVLIEKNQIGSGATGKAAGTLVVRGESDLLDYIKIHGREKGEAYWKEIQTGLNEIKKVIAEENIDCDAEPQDTLYCGFKHKSHIDLREEYREEKTIDPAAKFLEGDLLKMEVNTDLFTHGILSAGHGLSVNPLKFVQNLSVAAERRGVKIYENTALLRTKSGVAETHHGDIKYQKLIVAIDADNPAKEVRNLKSTIVVTEPLTESQLIQTGLIKKKIIFDAKENYDYFKLTKDHRLLFGFGGILVHKKHKKTDPHFPHLKSIQNFMKKLFPNLDLKPEYAWAGSFGVTGDYEPHIKFEDEVVSISGAGTQVICFMAAKHVVSKLILGQSPLEKYF